MRLTIGSLAALAALAGCDAPPAESAAYQATAVVEIMPPWAAPDGPRAAEPDDARIETAVEKIRLPQTIARAVREARLAALPAFDGRTEQDIAAEIASGLTVRRLAKAWLVEIVVAGETPGVLDDEANALAAAFVADETTSGTSDAEQRRLALEMRIAAKDAKIATAQSRARSALQKSKFSHATGNGDVDTLRSRLALLTAKGDEIEMDLIHLEAQPKSPSMTADERDALAAKRKALTNEQAALAQRASQTREQIAAAERVLADVADLNDEIARHLENRTAAMREIEEVGARATEPQRTARIVAAAVEPTSPR
jgi:hypothetical protein